MAAIRRNGVWVRVQYTFGSYKVAAIAQYLTPADGKVQATQIERMRCFPNAAVTAPKRMGSRTPQSQAYPRSRARETARLLGSVFKPLIESFGRTYGKTMGRLERAMYPVAGTHGSPPARSGDHDPKDLHRLTLCVPL